MQGEIVVAGTDEQKLLKETLERFHLPAEAVEYHVTTEQEDELLPGAKPQVQLHLSIRSDYVAQQAVTHLENILKIIGMDCPVATHVRNDVCFVNIEAGDDTSLLIGRDGQNLDALQYLVNRMILRVGREAPLVVIDVADYRRRQFEKLEKLAQRAAKRARETGNEIELDSMPGLERKYLHYYLRDEKDIQTFSRGEEPDRYLVIVAD